MSVFSNELTGSLTQPVLVRTYDLCHHWSLQEFSGMIDNCNQYQKNKSQNLSLRRKKENILN